MSNLHWGGGYFTNKNVKAFTLIELLAVIVILAIIAIIAVPIILGIVNNAKEKAFKSSLKNVEHAYSLYVAKHQEDADFDTSKEIDIKELPLDSKNLTGKVFTNAEGKIELKNITDGTYSASGTLDNLTIMKGKDKLEEEPQIITTEAAPEDTLGLLKVIYYDPTTNKGCDKSEYVGSTDEVKTGCMKWYAYKEDDTTYTAILDHNTTAQVVYNSLDDYDWSTMPPVTPKEIQTELDNLTKSVSDGGSGWQVTPRLIEGQEIADITGHTEWTAGNNDYFYFDATTISPQTQVANETNKSKYYWLFDYTYYCTLRGCKVADSSTWGYWTSTPYSSLFAAVWIVFYGGDLNGGSAYNDDSGLRPVINISKSKL